MKEEEEEEKGEEREVYFYFLLINEQFTVDSFYTELAANEIILAIEYSHNFCQPYISRHPYNSQNILQVPHSSLTKYNIEWHS